MVIDKWFNHLIRKDSYISSLVVFRIIFGLMMAVSTLRFILKGWINDLYITPKYYFTYFGFDWVTPFDPITMYILFGILLSCSIFIMIGLFYRINIVVFFLLFTYIELLDKTNYLNHYYFISLMSFLLIFLPAHRSFSLDCFFGFCRKKTFTPAWTINIIKVQLGIVYLFAGIAKLNYHWLFEAQPLINWLKHQSDFPLIGNLLLYDATAYIFSWCGAIFDLTIFFILISDRWRIFGYMFVVFFHLVTSIMFPIGVFPLIMVCSTLIFFSNEFHQKIIVVISKCLFIKKTNYTNDSYSFLPKVKSVYKIFFISFFIIQLLLPFRYLLYPGKLFWTEQGFRFSWRVMLIEKAGYAQFYVHEPKEDRKMVIQNCNYLTPQQEKMMSTQPDMILQYAHFLSDEFKDSTILESDGETINLGSNPKITANIQVSLFNKGSRTFIDPNINLASTNRGFKNKDWILPYEK